MTPRILPVLALLLACDADTVPRAAATNPTVAPKNSDEMRRASLLSVRPVDTRAGTLRFTDEIIKDSMAAGVFGERLADASVAVGERRALAEALPRCGGAWAQVSLARLAVEADAEVRAVLVAGLRRADEADALAGAKVGFADAAPVVRRAAAELAGWVPAVGVALRGALQTALADAAPEVRAAAARAIGLTGDAAAFDMLAPVLKDSEGQVRLEALRGLRRIDEVRAAALPAATSLREDPDARVRRAAVHG